MEELNALRPIIDDKNITINEKMEVIEAVFYREMKKEKRMIKEGMIYDINNMEEYDKAHIRIIVSSYLV